MDPEATKIDTLTTRKPTAERPNKRQRTISSGLRKTTSSSARLTTTSSNASIDIVPDSEEERANMPAPRVVTNRVPTPPCAQPRKPARIAGPVPHHDSIVLQSDRDSSPGHTQDLPQPENTENRTDRGSSLDPPPVEVDEKPESPFLHHWFHDLEDRMDDVGQLIKTLQEAVGRNPSEGVMDETQKIAEDLKTTFQKAEHYLRHRPMHWKMKYEDDIVHEWRRVDQRRDDLERYIVEKGLPVPPVEYDPTIENLPQVGSGGWGCPPTLENLSRYWYRSHAKKWQEATGEWYGSPEDWDLVSCSEMSH